MGKRKRNDQRAHKVFAEKKIDNMGIWKSQREQKYHWPEFCSDCQPQNEVKRGGRWYY
jgi:hypothetical protein